MAVPYGENQYIYGLHDHETASEKLMRTGTKAKGWYVITEKIGANPNDHGGRNYKKIADKGFGVIVRLNNSYADEQGSIPHSSKCLNFAQRAANFVHASKGAHIWIIGNEVNMRREQPPGEIITPRKYADCYRQVRAAIKNVPGHQNDQVLVSPIGPWNAETWYDADPQGAYPANKIPGAPQSPPYNGFFGDFIRYLRDMLVAIGPQNCDGIALHAYSHGYDPELVFSEEMMQNPPQFRQYHYQFRTYRDQMNAIPWAFRHLPVYITEANGDKNPDGSRWPDVNSGWVKNVYREINNWNKAGHQQIRCVALYRWFTDDEWTIKPKKNVQQDLKDAVKFNFKYDPDFVPQKPPAPEIDVQDISATLPTNPDLPPYPTRPLSQIRRFVLNHTATPPTVTPQRIAEFQTNNPKHPRSGIAYHYCITDAGEIYQTQPLTVVSDHAGQFSVDSVGLCLIGNFTDTPPPAAQLEATAALLANLSVELDVPLDGSTILVYRELAITASPGDTFDQWKPGLVAQAQQMLAEGVSAVPGYRAEYLSHGTPTQMPANQTLTVPITIKNTGKFTWVAGGANPFHLGFRWFTPQGQLVQFPSQFDFRTVLPFDVPPGQAVSLQAQLRTPATPGTYRLRWDMVQEMVTWFADQNQPALDLPNIVITAAGGISEPVVSPGQLNIQDISATLPTNPNLSPYSTRPLSQIRQFVLNHTATPPTVTPQRIAEFQTNNPKRPRPGIAYHYCVTDAGEIYQTQPLTVVSDHAGQFSPESVGICLIGNFTDTPPPAAQISATAALIAQVATQLNIPADASNILGYSDLAVTESPGKTWAQWRDALISQAAALRGGNVVQPPVTTPGGGTVPHPVPAGKVIRHYMLFWHHGGDNWAEWDLLSAVDYIGKFKPTVGFSVAEAKLAEYVTIVGGTGGVSAAAEQELRQAGCKVERLAGATQEETNQMLYDLVAAGRPFRSFEG